MHSPRLLFARRIPAPNFVRSSYRRNARFVSLNPLSMTRLRLGLLSIGALPLMLACGGGDSSGPPSVASVDIIGPTADIQVGGTVQLSATAKDAKGNTLTGKTVSWSTSSAANATVSNTGLVTGVGAGSASITASIDGKTASRNVNVTSSPIATITVTAASTALAIGGTTQATAVLRDANGNVINGRTFMWSSNNNNIATVNGTGVVTGIGQGKATISATAEGQMGSVEISVDPPTIASVSPSPMIEGQPATITGTKFGTSAAANTVRIGGVVAQVTSATATTLQIVVPAVCKPEQNVSVDVTTNGSTSISKPSLFKPTKTFALAQGQFQLIANPSDFCLQFPATTATETYLIGLQSISENVTSLTAASVIGDVPVAAQVSPRVSIATAPVFSAAFLDPLALRRTGRLAAHRAASAAFINEQRELLVSKLGSARAKRASRSQFAAASVPSIPGTAKVGDVINMKVPTRPNTCNLSTPIAVTVKLIGAHGIFVEDNGNPAGGFSATDYQTLSDRFDNEIYATDVAYFGEPSDFDQNGKIVIVITKEVNKVTPTILGQVIFGDMLPTECAASNDGEYFYGRAPDPNGTVGSEYTIESALKDAPIIIAHEFAHVLQVGRRIAAPTEKFIQSTWELEGQATFAEEVNGFAVTGRSPGNNYGFSVAFNDPETTPIDWFVDAWIDLVFYFGLQNTTSRVPNAPEQCSWLAQPPTNPGPCAGGRDAYGVPHMLFRFLSDQYGPTFAGGEKGLHRRLVDDDDFGYKTLGTVIGQPIDAILSRWAAALYADDRVPGLDPTITFTSWNLADVESRLIAVAHLQPRERSFSAFTDQVSVRAGSSAYFLVSGAGRPASSVRARDISDNALPGIMRMWVVRLR
jgi:hypothetical protein